MPSLQEPSNPSWWSSRLSQPRLLCSPGIGSWWPLEVLRGRMPLWIKTTVREHAAKLEKPILHATLFPGVPVALSDRWTTATKDKRPNPQEYFWLTMHITNAGHSYVGNLAADLSLLPAVSAIYPYSASSWNAPKVWKVV